MGKITIDEMHNSLFDYAQAVSDESLMTESKTIVGAINEIYGKNLIADSIGEPLNNTDTYTKMSNDINSLLSTFKTNMMNNGVTVESSDKFKELIDKVKTMVENGQGKGIQFAEGSLSKSQSSYGTSQGSPTTTTVDYDPGFIPTILLVKISIVGGTDTAIQYYTPNIWCSNTVSSANIHIRNTSKNCAVKITNLAITDDKSFIVSWTPYSGTTQMQFLEYIAIGVGEEDTTLRDSLASILENKGVDVTEEDDMASLISKVDGFIPHPPAIAGDDHIIYENTNVFTGYNQDGIGKLISEFNDFKIGGTYRIYFSSHSSGGHSSRPYYEHIRNSTVINTGQTYGGGWYAEVSTFDVPNVLPGDTIRFYMNSSASDWEVDKHGIRCSIDDSYFLI